MTPLHILALMRARGPWRLRSGRWEREFRCDDTGMTFVLLGPEATP